jgi:hypothetical protein
MVFLPLKHKKLRVCNVIICEWWRDEKGVGKKDEAPVQAPRCIGREDGFL